MDNNLDLDIQSESQDDVRGVAPRLIEPYTVEKPPKVRCGQRPLDPEGNVLPHSEEPQIVPVRAQQRADDLRPARRIDVARVDLAPPQVGNPFGTADDVTAQLTATPRVSTIPASRSLALVPPAISPQEIARRQAYIRQQLLEAQRLTMAANRPLVSRLTPVAWLTMGIGALVLVTALGFGARALFSPRVPEPAPASAPVLAFAGTPTAKPTVAPTVAPNQTATPAAPTLAPTEPPPTLVPTEPPPTAMPTAIPGAPWRSALTQDAEGNLMAPPEVVTQAEQSVLAYWTALTQHTDVRAAKRDLVDNQDSFLSRYFEGDALTAAKNEINTATQLPTYDRGNVTVRVLGFSADGFGADVIIEQRGWTTRFFERPELLRWLLKRIPDQSHRWKLRYDPDQNRWLVSQFVEKAVIKRERAAASSVRRPIARPTVAPVATAVPTAPRPDDARTPAVIADAGSGEFSLQPAPFTP